MGIPIRIYFIILTTFLTRTQAETHENNRCKCICPSISTIMNQTELFESAIKPIITNVPSNKCNCEGVILPKLGESIKGKEREFCPRCKCKYENRNVDMIKVVIIFIIAVIFVLVVYMLYLCVFNLVNKRGRGNYEELANEEVETTDDIDEHISHNRNVEVNIFNRVRHQQNNI